jgi:Caspase domain
MQTWVRLLLVLLSLGTALAAHAERRALIIGNSAYENISRLKAPEQDAYDIGQALQGLGFAPRNVMVRTNLNRAATLQALREFKSSVNEGDDMVVYYTGHGLQLGGSNYLLPTDVPPRQSIQSEDDIKDSAVRLQRLLQDMGERKARFTLLIVDACRDNPIQAAKSMGAGAGLAPESPSNGQMIVFAAGSGQLARDAVGANERNSLFTAVLLEHLKTPGLEVRQLVQQVKTEVHARAKAARHDQMPAVYDQAVGAFYFDKTSTISIRETSTPTLPVIVNQPLRKVIDYENGPVVFWSDGTMRLYDEQTMAKTCEEGMQYSAGRCIGEAKLYTLEEAKQAALHANQNAFAGYTNWMVPTVYDLYSLGAAHKNFTEMIKNRVLVERFFPNGNRSFYTWGLPATFAHTNEWDRSGYLDMGGGLGYKKNGRYTLRLMRRLQ